MKTKRPTKAQREQAAREAEAQNEKIRAQHEDAERQVKAREEEERRKAVDEAARKARDEEYARKAAEDKTRRLELEKKIALIDTEIVVLKKAERETEHLVREATFELIRFPDDEHHAKACDLAAKHFNLLNIYDVRVAERELLIAERDAVASGWSGILQMAMGGLAYYIASMFRTKAENEKASG